jgi:hypothetical protein
MVKTFNRILNDQFFDQIGSWRDSQRKQFINKTISFHAATELTFAQLTFSECNFININFTYRISFLAIL